MPKKILVATPHPAFGELLRISLEENGPYQVRLVQSSKEAQSSATRTDFSLAILDCDLSDPEMPEVARALMAHTPDIRLMIIPLENDNNPLDLYGVRVDGKVTRPYYLPDLLHTVQDLLTPAPAEPLPIEGQPLEETFQWQPESNINLPWQRDAGLARTQLESLMKESSADSLVIAHMRNLYAFSGSLEEEGAKLIAGELARYWDGNQKSDLVRFLAHESPEQDSLLYATALADEFILALVYDIPIPLTRCRAQAGKLVRLMMTPVAEEEVLPPPVIASQPPEEPAVPLEELQPPASSGNATPEQAFLDEEEPISEEDEEAMAASLANLLASMPVPNPTLPIGEPGEMQNLARQEAFHFPWELEEKSETTFEEPLDAESAGNPAPDEGQESLPDWLTSVEEKPVQPFSEPVVEEVWWSSIPVTEENPDQKGLPENPPSVPTPQLPIRQPEPIAQSEDQPEEAPQFSESSEASMSQPAWMEPETQQIPASELPALSIISESRLPTTPEEAATNFPLPKQKEEPVPIEKELDVADTQPYRVKSAKPVSSTEQTTRIARPPAATEEEVYQGVTRQVRTTRAARTPAEPVPQHDNFLADTNPHRVARRPASVEPPTERMQMQPPSGQAQPAAPAGEPSFGTTCTCVMIPFIPEHYLVAGMADLLKQSMVKVAAQKHWKISRVLVRPQFLQWTTETPEMILPDKVAEFVRKRLSEMIFKKYPTLKNQNRSGNFWSPEMLVLAGSEPPPAQRLRNFTRQARAQLENASRVPEKT